MKYFYFLLTIFSLSLALLSPTAIAMSESFAGNQMMPTLAPMLKKVLPSVVNISTKGTAATAQHPLMNDPFPRNFFPQQRRRTQGLGSGVIIDAKKGYIITN
jgi:S1-C subfamily serine protease